MDILKAFKLTGFDAFKEDVFRQLVKGHLS
jgi:hypothetical protein